MVDNPSPTQTVWPFAKSSIRQFREAYRQEHARTRKVLHAFPPEQSEFRPHERSNPARQLAWTFVIEEQLMMKALSDEPLGKGFPKAPESWAAILEEFDKQHGEIVKKLEALGDSELKNTVRFFVAPKQMDDYPALDFLFYILFDQIHHRGQLSVYVRMAGGKVPAIYGPSADEPWF